MTGNFFKVAIRIFYKYRSYTLVNVFALAIGLAGSIIIFLYVDNEYSYDRFHRHAKDMYRIGITGIVSGNSLNHAVTPAPLTPALLKEVPEVERAVRVGRFGAWLMRYKNTRYNEDNIIFADSAFFEMFSFRLVSGDPATVLDQPESVVLTGTTARRYFGDEDPVGKRLRVENDSTYYRVTGVMEDIPQNSHIHFDMVASLSTLSKYISRHTWVVNEFYTYIQVKEGIKKDTLNRKIQAMVDKYVMPAYYQMLNVEASGANLAEDRYEFILQPITDIHLKSNLELEFEPVGNRQYVTIFLALALLILAVACINFMNLATASTAHRAKEVSIRKVAGSDKKVLIQQFLTESVLITLLSLVLALFLVELLLPLFNRNIELHLSLAQLVTPKGILALFILVAMVGISAGLYPAFFLSSFNPVVVLRSWISRNSGSGYPRTGFVFFQFFIAVSVLSMTFIVYSQFRYLANKDLGFSKENLLIIRRPDGLRKNLENYRNAILKNEKVQYATNSLAIPCNIVNSNPFYLEGTSAEKNYHITVHMVNYDFLKTYEIPMSEGRFFDPSVESDAGACVINETAARIMGLDDPLGKSLVSPVPKKKEMLSHEIIGVVKDFHFQSLENPIGAMVIFLIRGNPEGYLSVKIAPEEREKTIEFLRSEWEKFTDAYPFVYFFLDEQLKDQYYDVQKTAKIFLALSVIALFIACLGLFGLVSFTTSHRSRDIGMRKILGAGIPGLVLLQLKDIVLLTGSASVLAWVLVYFLGNLWLKDYFYRIPLSPVYFILAAVIVIVIAVLTISRLTCLAAKINPGQAMRYE